MENKIRDQRARHAELERRYTDAMEEKLKEARHRLALYIQAMKGLSPLDKLNQGYSYVEKEGKAITSVQDVKEGDLLEICVSDGKITARREDIGRILDGTIVKKQRIEKTWEIWKQKREKKKEPLPVRHWKQHLENWIRCSKRWRAAMSAWKTFVYTRREWSF